MPPVVIRTRRSSVPVLVFATRSRRASVGGHARVDVRDAEAPARGAADRARQRASGSSRAASSRSVVRRPSSSSACLRSMKARTDGPVAVIDIGHERTDVVVVHDGKAVFSRSLARAGKQVTEAIAKFWRHGLRRRLKRRSTRDGFVASTAEPATNEAWQRDAQRGRPGAHAVRSRSASDTRRMSRSHRIRADRGAARWRWRTDPRPRLVHDRAARGCQSWRMTRDEDATALAGLKLGPVAHRTFRSRAAANDDRHGVRLCRWSTAVRSALRLARREGRSLVLACEGGCRSVQALLAVSSHSHRSRRTQICIGCAKARRSILATRGSPNETQDQMYGAVEVGRKTCSAMTGSGGGIGGADSPMPKMTAYDMS